MAEKLTIPARLPSCLGQPQATVVLFIKWSRGFEDRAQTLAPSPWPLPLCALPWLSAVVAKAPSDKFHNFDLERWTCLLGRHI